MIRPAELVQRYTRAVIGADAWRDYIGDFHRDRAGITERVLAQARDRGLDPYAWVAEPVQAAGSVLDLAGGSGPLADLLPAGSKTVLIDTAVAELHAARRRGARTLVQADAARLPLSGNSIDTVVCSMALMLLPLPDALVEIRRVLHPGGLLVATIPAASLLTLADRRHYTRLLLALRQPGLGYPNDSALDRPADLFSRAGLVLMSDERRRFVLPIGDPATGELLLDSLYLPGMSAHRAAAGRRVVRRWTGVELGIPLRRLIARVATAARDRASADAIQG